MGGALATTAGRATWRVVTMRMRHNTATRVQNSQHALGRNLPLKPRKRLRRHKSEPLAVSVASNQMWCITCRHDPLRDGRSFRRFNVFDDCIRLGLAIAANPALPAIRVPRALEQIIQWKRKPKRIRCGNGLENISAQLHARAKEQTRDVIHSQARKVQHNADVERYNRTRCVACQYLGCIH